MENRLSLGEKLFCEAMALLLAGWWLLLICGLYLVREYMVRGFLIFIGIAIVIALLEQIGEEKHDKETN